MHGFVLYQGFGKVRSLRSNRAWLELGRYVATEPWQDRGLLLVLEGVMTNSTYVSPFSFILIPDRFKVRDRFSAYMTSLLSMCRMYESHLHEMANAYDCLVFQEGVFIEEENFVVRTNLRASATSRDAEDLLFFRMPRFVLEMFAGLKIVVYALSDGAMIAQRLGVKDMFTQIAKDVVGDSEFWFRLLLEGVIDRGPKSACPDSLAKFSRVIRLKMADSRRKRFSALGRRSLRGLIQNQCGVSCGIAFSDVAEGKERQKSASRRAKK
ncbi:hypothetical protein DY000_02052416 [Brassica cretica]|uniref:Uncharacterized protein n=1 Tax=Brassica cretica TaxID=69181 RepID=A0ABQ7AKE2_BRACR|nr:hypothetical protein DY000_02052416 [Brassica cretica]